MFRRKRRRRSQTMQSAVLPPRSMSEDKEMSWLIKTLELVLAVLKRMAAPRET